jgi:isoquinoline 1-oxidoreductase beta subunit
VFRGIAQHDSFGSYAAQVAEIELGPNREVKLRRVVCAVDCGRVVNPDLVAAQVQSGVVFGLSATLFGSITLKGGAVEQSNFHEFTVARITDVPAIEVHIVASEHAPSGIGEPAVPPVAPAIANALWRATGERLRALPLALAAKT